jgi:uncharacterized repeat protein (TIGR03803 family)
LKAQERFKALTRPDSLALDSEGDLFGTTFSGGRQGQGTVFEIGSDHTTFSSLISFTGSSGAYPGSTPAGGLFVDGSGNLFGMTPTSGEFGDGTVFEGQPQAADSITVNQGGTATMGVPGAAFEQTMSSITLGFAAKLTLPTVSVGHSVLDAGAISSSGSIDNWNSKIDLANNDLDMPDASLAVVFNQIQQGYDSAAWTGNGITSTTAAADSTHLTALGVIQNNQSGSALFTAANTFDGTVPGAGDVLVKYTYYGDANLDGKVDGSDYSPIDNGYLNHLTSWFNGDFNYDGAINGSDYTLIDNAFNSQGASLAAQIAPMTRKAAASTVLGRSTTLFSDAQSLIAPQDGAPLSSITAGIFARDGSDPYRLRFSRHLIVT